LFFWRKKSISRCVEKVRLPKNNSCWTLIFFVFLKKEINLSLCSTGEVVSIFYWAKTRSSPEAAVTAQMCLLFHLKVLSEDM
jgi:hypothetical protein